MLARPVGRFAPSPTGPLHFGSLVAALGSYLNVAQRNGTWIVRIDDIDPPREASGAAADILRTLETFGFEWDRTDYQSNHTQRYLAALELLNSKSLIFGCTCTRKQIAATAPRGELGAIYPGTCRGAEVRDDNVWRVRATGQVEFIDRIHGQQSLSLEADAGDFIVRRRGGLFAYQLACAVDDGNGIDEVVRGADLLSGTGLQHYLRDLLELKHPSYAHLPVAVDADGNKLSKQTGAHPVSVRDPVRQLLKAWAFLGQVPVAAESLDEFWPAAIRIWDLDRVAPA